MSNENSGKKNKETGKWEYVYLLCAHVRDWGLRGTTVYIKCFLEFQALLVQLRW